MGTSVKIEFSKLQNKTYQGDSYAHIHGHLNFEIGGRSVLAMGYFGPNDVCFNTWIVVFVGIIKAVKERRESYKFDEYEQGQSAFLFEVKSPAQVVLSIIKSESGEGYDHPDWQNIAFSYADFEATFLGFKSDFLGEISRIAPHQLKYWSKKFQT